MPRFGNYQSQTEFTGSELVVLRKQVGETSHATLSSLASFLGGGSPDGWELVAAGGNWAIPGWAPTGFTGSNGPAFGLFHRADPNPVIAVVTAFGDTNYAATVVSDIAANDEWRSSDPGNWESGADISASDDRAELKMSYRAGGSGQYVEMDLGAYDDGAKLFVRLLDGQAVNPVEIVTDDNQTLLSVAPDGSVTLGPGSLWSYGDDTSAGVLASIDSVSAEMQVYEPGNEANLWLISGDARWGTSVTDTEVSATVDVPAGQTARVLRVRDDSSQVMFGIDPDGAPVLRSPNGALWRLLVDNSGNLATEAVV